MKTLVAVVIDHGEDTDTLTKFIDQNIRGVHDYDLAVDIHVNDVFKVINHEGGVVLYHNANDPAGVTKR